MSFDDSQDKKSATWSIGLQPNPVERRLAETALLMAWARDRKTGVPRYILELDEHHRGADCDCNCVSCGAELIAVNAARKTFVRRPHFRHATGTDKHSCVVQAARLAVLATLESTGYLDLPSRRRTAQIMGLSGAFYDAWAEAPAERVRIASCSFSDIASAVVTLDDGRELRVVFIGSQVSNAEGASHAVIEVLVDDPALAAMSSEELRDRARLLICNAHWCEHWQDDALIESAMEQARELAADGLDLLDEDEDADLLGSTTPQDMRETLLHRKAKELLEREKRIMVPQMAVTEPSPEWPLEPIARKLREAQMLELESVVLEQRTGRIIPDVTATTAPAPGCQVETLLIEITVTNGINEERRARILETNLPTLEIDLSRLGGRVTEAEFTRLIVEELAGKRWLHHPEIEVERSRIHSEWTAIRTERDAQTSQREGSRSSTIGGHRVPPRVYPEPDLWLKGKALEQWKREHPEEAAAWYSQKE
ncbi:hypothetical protein [Cupriavidus sp. D384]|uniref:hypothetical protein n=1 Tax=Cupriavidus sp. D384 TaxID=1538095 RepID=UPI000A42A1A6|nr:hypothetical protein [Cupriavidus sp. D384]